MNFLDNPILLLQFENKIPKPGKTGLDWFFFCYFLNKFKNTNMLEIGAGNGGSTFTMSAFTKDITIIDNWQYGWNKKSVETIVDQLNLTFKFIDTSSEILNSTELETYKFIHLDAHRDYQGALADLQLSQQICTGIICVDDYMNTMWPEVTWAVTDFIQNNPDWKIVFIGNHQVFLSKNSIDIKELIVDFPVVTRMNSTYLTYGSLPDYTDQFVKNGKMQYSWHQISTINNKINF
jgi:hypothetical protein